MDVLTPLLILAAKNASENAAKDAPKTKPESLPFALSAVLAASSATFSASCIAIGAGIFPFIFGSSKAEPKDKLKINPNNKQENTVNDTNPQPPAVDEKLVEAVVERVRSELPALIETINNAPSQTIVSETYDVVYTSQIAKAQEFLNENHSADLSRVKCLLHKLLPKEYFDMIEQLREHQNPQSIVHIHGGQNIIAPKAEQAKQHIENKP